MQRDCVPRLCMRAPRARASVASLRVARRRGVSVCVSFLHPKGGQRMIVATRGSDGVRGGVVGGVCVSQRMIA